MSRFSDYYEERWPNELMMLDWNRQQALKGEKGQKALRELKEILLKMPSKRLIEGTLSKDGDVCLVGAYVVGKGLPLPEVTGDPRMDWDGENYKVTLAMGQRAGLSKPLTEQFSWMNDGEWESCTPEQRYERALRWIDSELATA